MKYETYLSYVWASKGTLIFGAVLLAAGLGLEYAGETPIGKFLTVPGILVVGVTLALPLIFKDYLED